MSTPHKVAVAMSGGVDSSVAAALLLEQGYEVFGLMLRLWEPPAPGAAANRCCSPRDMASARSVAAQLGFSFHVLDAQSAFKVEVVSLLVRGYAQGITPNPCLACNRHIRWGVLLDHALAMGADFLATGHYARLRQDGERLQLLRAADHAKDQTYVLSALRPSQLAHARFPLGEWTKTQVREIARRHGLAVAERPESQDLCFLGGTDVREFLRDQDPAIGRPGEIVDRGGTVVGRHTGLYQFTIGQRKGIGVPSPHPLYVVDKDPHTQRLTIGPREALGRSRFTAAEVNWIAGEPPASQADLLVRVRYKAPEVPARIRSLGSDRLGVELSQPLPDITPGQQAVFYRGDVCLGGGVIVA